MSLMKRTPFGSLEHELRHHMTTHVNVDEDHHVMLEDMHDLWKYVNGFHGGHDEVRMRRLSEAVFAHPDTMKNIPSESLMEAFVGLFRVWRNSLYSRMLESANGCETLEDLYAKIEETRKEYEDGVKQMSAREKKEAGAEAKYFTAQFRKGDEVDKLLGLYVFRAIDTYLKKDDARSVKLREDLAAAWKAGVFTPKPELQ